MTTTYTALDATKPNGSQTGSTFAGSANTNDLALWYGVISGQLPGWAYSQSGGTAEQPATQTWANGVYRVRHTNTWGTTGGAAGNLATVVVAVSSDSGVSFATVCTIGNTFDASGNMTASTGGGGLIGWLSYLLGKVKALLANFNAHAAATGTSVHGLGSLALQSAAAVNIDGGSIDATVIGGTTRTVGYFTQAREQHVAVTFGATTTLDWAAGASFSFTATGSGAASLVMTNGPISGIVATITVEITNGGLRTWTYPSGTKWAGGTPPVLSTAGRDRLTFVTRDGGVTIDGYLTGKAMA